MIDSPEPSCWLHPHVEVSSSPIAGLGLFATAPIAAGTVVSRLGGRLVSGERLRELFVAEDRDSQHLYIDTITVGGVVLGALSGLNAHNSLSRLAREFARLRSEI